MYTAKQIANYLLWKGGQVGESDISHLKLQKLLYYVQGFSLALTNKPCFRENILAWEHGPVVQEIYNLYSRGGSRPLAKPKEFEPKELSKETRQLIDEVFDTYGQFSAWRLREMTHKETPWKSTPQSQVITHDKMKDYFVNFVCE